MVLVLVLVTLRHIMIIEYNLVPVQTLEAEAGGSSVFPAVCERVSLLMFTGLHEHSDSVFIFSGSECVRVEKPQRRVRFNRVV